MRKLSLLISMFIAVGLCKPVFAEDSEITAGDLEVGDKIIRGSAKSDKGELYSNTEDGTISWIVVENHYGNDGITVLGEYILTRSTFATDTDSYEVSHIRKWLQNNFLVHFA